MVSLRTTGAARRDAQAAFLLLNLPTALAEDRINEDGSSFFDLRSPSSLATEQSVGEVHLIRGESDSLMLVHEFEHLRDHRSQFGVHLLDWLRQMPKRRMRILDDF
jgi:hypothetical protein